MIGSAHAYHYFVMSLFPTLHGEFPGPFPNMQACHTQGLSNGCVGMHGKHANMQPNSDVYNELY